MNNRVSITLKLAATTLRLSKTYLGARFRRLRSRRTLPSRSKPWPPSWHVWSTVCCAGMKYVDRGAEFYEAQHRQL